MRENMETNDQVNRDAAKGVPCESAELGGSGSTPCSFSAIPLLCLGFMSLGLMMSGFAYANLNHAKTIVSRIDQGNLDHESLESSLARQHEEILELKSCLLRMSEKLAEK